MQGRSPNGVGGRCRSVAAVVLDLVALGAVTVGAVSVGAVGAVAVVGGGCAGPVATPVSLTVAGQRSAITTTGTPNHVYFRVAAIGEPAWIAICDLVALDGTATEALSIERVEVDRGVDPGVDPGTDRYRPCDRIAIAPGVEHQVLVTFRAGELSAHRDEWRFRAEISTSLGLRRAGVTVGRAFRDPIGGR